MSRWRLEQCSSLLSLLCALILAFGVRAAVDEAGDLTVVDAQTNIIQADNPGQEQVDSLFTGDASRFARQTNALGSLTYEEAQGIDQVSLIVYALTTPQAGDWQLSVTVGARDVLTLTAQQLQEAFASTTVRPCISRPKHLYYVFDSTALV